MLTKEPGIALPVVLLAIDLWSRACPAFGRSARQLGATYALFGALAIGFLVLRRSVLGGSLQGADHFVLAGDSLYRAVEYGLGYLRMLVVPWPVPFYFRHLDGGTMDAITLVAGSIMAAAVLVALCRGSIGRIAAIWLGVTLAVPLALAMHRLGVFGARFLYLPSAGAVLLAAVGYVWLKHRHNLAAVALPPVILLAFAVLTFRELPHWRDELSWTAHVIASDPSAHYGWSARAKHFERLGQLDNVAETYRRAAQAVSEPRRKASFLEQLAVHEAEQGRYETSIETYRQVSAMPGFEANGFIGIGNNLWVTGRLAEAVSAYDQALKHDPASALALFNRGLLSESLGDREAALDHYRRLLELPAAQGFGGARRRAQAFVNRYGRP